MARVMDSGPLIDRNDRGRGEHRFGLLDLLIVTAENIWLLILVGLVTGVLAYVYVRTNIKQHYVSSSYLTLTASQAEATEPLLRSPAVLGVVASKFPDADGPSEPPEAHARALNGRVSLSLPPGANKKTAVLYRLDVVQTDPVRAQRINAMLISAWLEATRPKPLEKARLDRQIVEGEAQLKSIAALIDRYGNDLMGRPAPSTSTGSPDGALYWLVQERARLATAIERLKFEAAGMTSDTIMSPPTVASESYRPGEKAIVGGSILVAVGLTWLLLCLREAVLLLAPDDAALAKLARLRAAFRFRRDASQ